MTYSTVTPLIPKTSGHSIDPTHFYTGCLTLNQAQNNRPQNSGLEEWLIDGQYRARVALSCLIQPLVGDRVLYCADTATEDTFFITQILSREQVQRAAIAPAGVEELSIHCEQIRVTAVKTLDLASAGDCQITAASGALRLSAQNLLSTIAGTAIHTARHSLSRFGECALEVKHLFKLHGRRQLITAEKEIKMDADIIHMG